MARSCTVASAFVILILISPCLMDRWGHHYKQICLPDSLNWRASWAPSLLSPASFRVLPLCLCCRFGSHCANHSLHCLSLSLSLASLMHLLLASLFPLLMQESSLVVHCLSLNFNFPLSLSTRSLVHGGRIIAFHYLSFVSVSFPPLGPSSLM